MKKYVCCGILVGFVNGFFGGGGGAILVPLLLFVGKLESHEALACSVAIILPLCMWSALLYERQGNLEVLTALPYCLGGAIGGLLGGKLFRKAKPHLLQKVFAVLLLFSGLRSILR